MAYAIVIIIPIYTENKYNSTFLTVITMNPLPDVKIGNEDPLYNIGVVARMTGISMATLRAWERRYDFPESERTSGGHRLYSERGVLRLQWVKERIDEGMQTAQAINALRHQEKIGNIEQSSISKNIEAQSPVSLSPGTHLTFFMDRLFDLLAQKNLPGADVLLGEALAVISPDHLILDVIGPTMARIGDAWEAGLMNIATEHLATNYLRQRLLIWMMSGPPPRALAPILLACAPGDFHEGSLLILGALLRRRGWPVEYLGQAVPLLDLAAFVRDSKPAIVIVVAMTEQSAEELMDWPQYLPESLTTMKPIISYGGRIYTTRPEWRIRTPGIYLGDNFREAIEKIERLLG
jgi:MerR family transcriptional regulator, light-induced transcriptional regulator